MQPNFHPHSMRIVLFYPQFFIGLVWVTLLLLLSAENVQADYTRSGSLWWIPKDAEGGGGYFTTGNSTFFHTTKSADSKHLVVLQNGGESDCWTVDFDSSLKQSPSNILRMIGPPGKREFLYHFTYFPFHARWVFSKSDTLYFIRVDHYSSDTIVSFFVRGSDYRDLLTISRPSASSSAPLNFSSPLYTFSYDAYFFSLEGILTFCFLDALGMMHVIPEDRGIGNNWPAGLQSLLMTDFLAENDILPEVHYPLRRASSSPERTRMSNLLSPSKDGNPSEPGTSTTPKTAKPGAYYQKGQDISFWKYLKSFFSPFVTQAEPRDASSVADPSTSAAADSSALTPTHSVREADHFQRWFTLHQETDSFAMYRACVHFHKSLPRKSNILQCWNYLDQKSKLSMDVQSLVNFKIQLLYDLVANRFPDVSFAEQTQLIQFLMAEAASWTPKQSRAVLFYMMRHGRRMIQNVKAYTIARMGWDGLCAIHFQAATESAPATPPIGSITECLQAASILAETGSLVPAKVLSWFGISNTVDLRKMYRELHSKCLRIIDASFWTTTSSAGDADLDPVRALLDNCADINHQFYDGSTSLMRAALKGSLEIVQFLLQRGANLNMACNTGSTALMYAIGRRKLDVVRFLLENGANPNILDRNGNTALYYAAKRDYPEVTQLLLERGMDKLAVEKAHDTALEEGHQKVVGLFRNFLNVNQ